MSDDLVARLRDLQHHANWTSQSIAELVNKAADRIEALEKRWDLQIDDGMRIAAQRISKLEAALREIAEIKRGTNVIQTRDVARRALEGKV